MQNLAGVQTADEAIHEELFLADIAVVPGNPAIGEVPYSLTGKIGEWQLKRAWNYWVAKAPRRRGLSLEAATALHEAPYPISGREQPVTYGEVVRPGGNRNWDPEDCAQHYDADGHELIVDPEGSLRDHWQKAVANDPSRQPDYEKLRFVSGLGDLAASSVISTYHIHTLPALKTFAGFVRTLPSS
ncbi:MAG: hypothetical protein OXR66_01630 [Candidatus Woesearchaeota archaeon]|nr:hypothetical protein [Candidatus Woesearchaeota archaeon]